jgi:hypothetical protein
VTTVRESLKRSIEQVLAHPATGLGYELGAVVFGEEVELTLTKAGGSFVAWLLPAARPSESYDTTERFKVGHRGNPPDRQGYKVLDAVCARLRAWERGLPRGAEAALFAPPLAPAAPAPVTPVPPPPIDPVADELLGAAEFEPIHAGWLEERAQRLRDRLAALPAGASANVLLVNATKGRPLFPSVADFFQLLHATHQGIRFTSTSYFPEIFDLQDRLAERGIEVVAVEELSSWAAADFNRYDVILMVGPSEATARLVAMGDLRARLVILDLAFYHQMIESTPGWRPGGRMKPGGPFRDVGAQRNRVVVYSCQTEKKIRRDLAAAFQLSLLDWRWFNYIPIGFSYSSYVRTGSRAFDVALLGTVRRSYAAIAPELYRGVRFLFLGNPDDAPEIGRLRGALDLTVAPHVDQHTYVRLLALSRCVLMPFVPEADNSLLSLVDTIAAGRPLITSRHPGIERLEAERLPALYFDGPEHLGRVVRQLLDDTDRQADIERRAIEFAREKMDIYRVLERIVVEQMLV